MFARLPWLLGWLFLGGLVSGARAEAPSASMRADKSPPACLTESCNMADAIIDDMRDIIWTSRTTPMGLGGPTPGNIRYAHEVTRPAVVNRKIQAALLSHRERFDAICARLADIMSQYDDKAQQAGSYQVNELLQIAFLMDAHSRRKCLPRIISRLPLTANAESLIESARGFCIESQWRRPACKHISRNPPSR